MTSGPLGLADKGPKNGPSCHPLGRLTEEIGRGRPTSRGKVFIVLVVPRISVQIGSTIIFGVFWRQRFWVLMYVR